MPLREQREPVGRNLAGRNTDHCLANGATVHGVDLSEVNQRNGDERTSEVAEPNNDPVLQHAGPVDFARCLRAAHKRVAREQLSAAAQHKHEAEAEANAANHALRRERNCWVA